MHTVTPAPAHPVPEAHEWQLDTHALDQLRALSTPTRPDFLANTLRMFLAQVPETIAQLEDGVARADPPTVRQAAHTLKSNAALIGAVALSGAFQRIEALARRGTLDPLRPLVQEARTGFGFVEAHIVEILASDPNV